MDAASVDGEDGGVEQGRNRSGGGGGGGGGRSRSTGQNLGRRPPSRVPKRGTRVRNGSVRAVGVASPPPSPTLPSFANIGHLSSSSRPARQPPLPRIPALPPPAPRATTAPAAAAQASLARNTNTLTAATTTTSSSSRQGSRAAVRPPSSRLGTGSVSSSIKPGESDDKGHIDSLMAPTARRVNKRTLGASAGPAQPENKKSRRIAALGTRTTTR
jgi:hypothetical protein